VIFRGDGEEAFSVGADIREFEDRFRDSAQAKVYSAAVAAALNQIARMDKPTVAMIQGACAGGGLQLAISMDLRIAARGSRFGIPVTRLGIVVGWEGLQHLLHLVGVGTASDLLLTGRMIGAQEAYRVGLISRLVERDQLEAATDDLAAEILQGAPLTHHWHKDMIRIIQRVHDLSVLSQEQRDIQYACFDTSDFQIGYRAFLEKRTPVFQGR
jgi:enoyl-CoA hydratase/carnithine racemase